MTRDLTQLNISEADWTDIDGALFVLETRLSARLLELSDEQRGQLSRISGTTESFCRQALIGGRQNAFTLPSQTALDLIATESALASIEKIRPRLVRLTALQKKAADVEMVLGNEVMVFSLFLYGILKAIGEGTRLDQLRGQLKICVPPPTKKASTPRRLGSSRNQRRRVKAWS